MAGVAGKAGGGREARAERLPGEQAVQAEVAKFLHRASGGGGPRSGGGGAASAPVLRQRVPNLDSNHRRSKDQLLAQRTIQANAISNISYSNPVMDLTNFLNDRLFPYNLLIFRRLVRDN
jgi:hypothetical protein